MNDYLQNTADLTGVSGARALGPNDVLDCNDFTGWSQANLDRAARLAVENGMASKIAPLAAAGADMNAPAGRDDEPLLVFALNMNSDKVAQALIEHGADVNARGKHGVFPLSIAIVVDATDIARSLMKHPDIDLHAVCEHGVTALHEAAEYGIMDIAQHLVENGVDPNAPDSEGVTPMHRVCWDAMPEVGRSTDMIAFLMEKGEKLDVVDQEGYRPIHFAATSSSKELLQFVIDQGADIGARTNDGSTPLHYAAGGRSFDNVMTLLANKAPLTVRDERGRTPYDVAKNDPKAEAICDALQMYKANRMKNLRRLRPARRPAIGG